MIDATGTNAPGAAEVNGANAQTTVDIDESNAQRYLIEESMQRPVLVDIWAEWCAPCKALLPILEKLAAEHQGRFLLARVNADEQQAIAAQLGARSLPTVLIIRNGQPVDGFTGAQPESAVRAMLEKHLPSPWAALLEEAAALLAAGREADALPLLRRAFEESGGRLEIRLALCQALLSANRIDEAEPLLEDARPADRDAVWEQLKAQLAIQREAARSPEIKALEARAAKDPRNMKLRRQLAAQYSANGLHRDALETLYQILQSNRNDADARQALLNTLSTLGKGNPLAAQYQRKLFGLLH